MVAPRDPPPLYTWEVYPGLYPPAPLPRGNPFRWGRGLAVLLALAAAVLLGAAASLAVVGAATASSGPVTVEGIVETASGGGSVPVLLGGASVHLVGESGYNRTVLTDADGRFLFTSVPPGGIDLNVSYGDLEPAALDLFASPFYTTGSLTHLVVRLSDGSEAGSTEAAESDFADMEEYLTDVDTGAVLLAIGGSVTALGAVVARRPDGAVAATAAGAGAAVSPVAFYVLGLWTVFPSLLVSSGLALGLGVVGATLAGMRRFFLGPFEGDPVGPGPGGTDQPSGPGSSGAAGGSESGRRDR